MFACLKLSTDCKMVRFYYLYVTTYGILNSPQLSCVQFYVTRSSRLHVFDKPVKMNYLHTSFCRRTYVCLYACVCAG